MRETCGAIIPLKTYVNFRRDSWDTERLLDWKTNTGVWTLSKEEKEQVKSPSFSSQFSSFAQSCPSLCDPMDCNMPGLPVHHQLPEFSQTQVHRVSDAIQPSHPLLSPFPPTFNLSQSYLFSNESVLCFRWPKYWSFSINLSNEYSGLISFRIDLLDLLAVQGTLKNFLHQFLWLLSQDIPRVLESESQDPWTKTIYEIQEGGDMGVPMADSCWCMTENHKIL